MENPKIVERKSRSVNLDAGVYYYCRCGLSADGIFCDGSHKGTSFTPKKFIVDEPASVYICMCKHTKNSPFCDGAHKVLPKE
jgi:CDGSH-type Zn-finger protein